MSKSKYDSSYPYAWETAHIVRLKQHTYDVVCDFKTIFPIQLKRFKDVLIDKDYESYIALFNSIKEAKLAPEHLNRVYIITDFIRIPFILMDLENSEREAFICNINHLKATNGKKILDISPSYITTIFVFHKDGLVYQEDIYPQTLSQLMLGFHRRNLVSSAGISATFCKHHTVKS